MKDKIQLNIGRITKENLGLVIQELSDQVLDAGTVDVEEMFAKAMALEYIGKELKAKLQNEVLDRANGVKGSSLTRQGIKLTMKSRSNYDFSHCPAWVEADTEKKRLETLMKAIDKDVADTETGEVISPAKVKYQSQYITVEIPKS